MVHHYAYLQGIFNIIFGFCSTLFFIKVLYSSIKHNNRALKYLSFAAAALALDYFIEGTPLVVTPNDEFAITFAITGLGPILITLTLCFMGIVVVITRSKHLSIYTGFLPLLVGIFSAVLNLIHNQGMVGFTETGFIDLKFNPLAEFLTFFTSIIVVILFSDAFASQLRMTKLNPRILFIAIGAVMVAFSSPITYSARNAILFYLLNGLTLIGLIFLIIGTYLKNKEQHLLKKNELSTIPNNP